MLKVKQIWRYFTNFEKGLWLSSVGLILGAFFLFDRGNYLALISSLVGVTSLIFIAKGNLFGQILMLVFSVLYGVISFMFTYYGEVLTYLGMTAPMSAVTIVSWARNPYSNKKTEVKMKDVSWTEFLFAVLLSGAVTVAFYFLLKWLNNANLIMSTVSVYTSFLAAYLSFRRTPWYALAYAVNDLVLVVLWLFATLENLSYLSVLICFVVFFFNDLYGFINWRKIQRRQAKGAVE